jgi:regulator of protease activity HflC (stomatin/prohibitin superfamily)
METLEIILISAIGLLAGSLFVWALASSMIIIQEYETGVYLRLGKYVKNLGPGLHLVAPFVSKVYRADKRIQTLDLGRHEVMTKDLSPTVIEAIVQYSIDKPDRSLLKIDKYKTNLNQIAYTTLRKLALAYDLEGLIRHQDRMNSVFFKKMTKEVEPFGLKIVRTEIRDIDPVGPVKAAIEDRIAAEKEREAMILRADGKKKALQLEMEGRR